MKKNIMIVVSEFPPGPGGIGDHAYNLAMKLSEKGYRINILTYERQDFKSQSLNFDKELPFNIYRYGRKGKGVIGLLVRLFFIAKKIFSTSDSDIIIASGNTPFWLLAMLSYFMRKIDLYSIIHGAEINHPKGWKKKVSSWSSTRYKKLIAVSRYTKTIIEKVSKNNNVVVIPNGYNELKIQNNNKIELSGSPSLITVGAVSARKGQHNIIKATPTIIKHYPKFQYHMVGIPKDKSKLVKLANKLGISSYVNFHGTLSDENLFKHILGSDIFVMLSEEQNDGDVEGFGIAIIEANACGIPAIGSKNCGIEDAISNKYSGLLVDPKDPNKIVNSISSILDNYSKYSINAVKWSKSFTWDSVINKYIDAIEN